MRLWNQLAQDSRLIKIFMITNVLQFIIIIGLVVVCAMIPSRLTVHIPPDISNGATLSPYHIPNANVGQFAYFVWQLLNTWDANGAVDAKEQLSKYRYYLSPKFRYQVNSKIQSMDQRGELSQRVRIIRPTDHMIGRVVKLNHDTWLAEITIRSSEYVNGVMVKDKIIQYPFRVRRFANHPDTNPFGLVLDGFVSPPVINKTIK